MTKGAAAQTAAPFFDRALQLAAGQAVNCNRQSNEVTGRSLYRLNSVHGNAILEMLYGVSAGYLNKDGKRVE